MVEFSADLRTNPGRLLPVPVAPAQHKRQHKAGSTQAAADFASQLIAERDHLPVQRARRRAGEGDALVAYDRSARLGERRLPIGYFLQRSV